MRAGLRVAGGKLRQPGAGARRRPRAARIDAAAAAQAGAADAAGRSIASADAAAGRASPPAGVRAAGGQLQRQHRVFRRCLAGAGGGQAGRERDPGRPEAAGRARDRALPRARLHPDANGGAGAGHRRRQGRIFRAGGPAGTAADRTPRQRGGSRKRGRGCGGGPAARASADPAPARARGAAAVRPARHGDPGVARDRRRSGRVRPGARAEGGAALQLQHRPRQPGLARHRRIPDRCAGADQQPVRPRRQPRLAPAQCIRQGPDLRPRLVRTAARRSRSARQPRVCACAIRTGQGFRRARRLRQRRRGRTGADLSAAAFARPQPVRQGQPGIQAAERPYRRNRNGVAETRAEPQRRCRLRGSRQLDERRLRQRRPDRLRRQSRHPLACRPPARPGRLRPPYPRPFRPRQLPVVAHAIPEHERQRLPGAGRAMGQQGPRQRRQDCRRRAARHQGVFRQHRDRR